MAISVSPGWRRIVINLDLLTLASGVVALNQAAKWLAKLAAASDVRTACANGGKLA